MKKLFLLILLVSTFNLSFAQNADSVVKRVAASFLASGVPAGFSIGIVKNNITSKYNFGQLQKGKQAAPTDQTLYEIGSVTKTFTSLLLAEAVVQKKVKLTDDIRKYLKGSYPNLEYKGQPVRLLHLANLTSGLPNNLPEQMPAMKTMNPDSQIYEISRFHNGYSKAQFLKDLHDVKLTVQPGLSPAHSNTAAQLLGFLLENVYGKSYKTLLARYITGPLKMSNTFFSVPTSKKSLCAPGHNEKGTLMPTIPRDAGSAGALKSSLNDMLIYLRYQLQQKDKRVILGHQPSWGNMDSYAVGLGWSVKTSFDAQRKIWASGGTFGQSCYICFYPERDYGIVILSNESDNQAEDRLSGMAQTIYNETFFTAQERAKEGFGYSAAIGTLLDSLNKYGFGNAIRLAGNLKQHSSSFKLIEDELNLWRYKYFFQGQKEKALEIFKLNVHLYPNSANTYDSLAETYEELGDKASAIKNYKQELRLNPGNKDIADHLKKLEGQ